MNNTEDYSSKKEMYSVWDGKKVKAVKERSRHYIITSAEELAWVSNMVNRKKRNFAGKIVLLKCNIDLAGHPWTPVGTSENYPFCGEFDGGGHVIRRVNVRSHFEHVGFFGCIRGNSAGTPVVIHDVRLLELNVEGVGLFSCSGGLAGCVEQNVKIHNCTVKGNVESKYCAGALIGVAKDQVDIKDCIVSGTILGAWHTGGLVNHLLNDSSETDCGVTIDTFEDECKDSIIGMSNEDLMINGSV